MTLYTCIICLNAAMSRNSRSVLSFDILPNVKASCPNRKGTLTIKVFFSWFAVSPLYIPFMSRRTAFDPISIAAKFICSINFFVFFCEYNEKNFVFIPNDSENRFSTCFSFYSVSFREGNRTDILLTML